MMRLAMAGFWIRPSASDGLKHEKPRVPARGSATGRHGPYLGGSTIHSIVGPAFVGLAYSDGRGLAGLFEYSPMGHRGLYPGI